MRFEPIVKAMNKSTSQLVIAIFFSICFYAGITDSSAIQRYRDLHDLKKIDLDDKSPRTNKIQKVINDDDTIDVDKSFNSKDKSKTLSASWDLTRFSSETYLKDISSVKIIDDLSSTSNTAKPSLTLNNKKLSASVFGCTATCGGCMEITSVSGVIMSPNYPDHYYSHKLDIAGYMYCQYTIRASKGKRINLVFQELNIAFTDFGDFLEVVDNSPDDSNYGKVLATFNAGDEAVATTTSGESMSIFFEANQGGYTKNGKAPAWKATYTVVEKSMGSSHTKLTEIKICNMFIIVSLLCPLYF